MNDRHLSRRPRPSLARRALPAIVLTSASGFLLSALDHPSTVVDAGNQDASNTGGSAAGVSIIPATAATPVSAATIPVASDTASSTSADAPLITESAPDTAPAETMPAETMPAETASAASTVPAAPVCTTYDGPTTNTRWGPVQVQASVAPDGTICWADAIVTPDSRSKSVQINRRAVPVFDERAVAAQGTSFDGVSGATITSNGYKQSLQAILDAVASGQIG